MASQLARQFCQSPQQKAPEENLCQKNPKYNKQAPMPQLQQQVNLNECQQKQRRYISNRIAANETAEKCNLQQQQQPTISQPPTPQQQQRANPRTKSLPPSLSNAMNLQPRPGPGCVIPQAAPPAEACNANTFMPANAGKYKCQGQTQRCALSQSPPPNQSQQPQSQQQQRCNYPQSQSPPPPQSQQNACVKNNRSPSPLSGTSSRPCTASSTSTVVACSNSSPAGADVQGQGYAQIPSARPSQTGGQCIMKQQMQTSISQPSPPHNFNARPSQMGRNRPNPGYNCSMGNRPHAQYNLPSSAGSAGNNMCVMPQINLRKNNQCVGMPPPNFQYEGQTNQHQMEQQKFSSPQSVMDMQNAMPPSEPNQMHQPCSGPPQAGFNACGNMYQKSMNPSMRPSLPPPPNRGGRGCAQYANTAASPAQCDNDSWNRNVQQECCYTSDTDNCDADGDNRFDDASGYPTGDEYNCECFSDTADEFGVNNDNITDDEQPCDMEFDDDYNANECNQNDCTFQVQDYGHSNKEECQCGNQSPKACIPDCSDNKVQVVIQIPQHLGRQEERKQEDDFDCVRGIQGRNLLPSNTQTTQTSSSESRQEQENRDRDAQAAFISLCPGPDKITQQGSLHSQLPIILIPQPQKKSNCEPEKPIVKPDEEVNQNDIKIYYNPQTFNIQSFIESVQTSKLIYYPPPQSFDPLPLSCSPTDLPVSQSPNACSSPQHNNNPAS